MLKDNFCSSPWFHIAISPDGFYRSCRWGDLSIKSNHHISNTSLIEYLNSDVMSGLRFDLLEGQAPKLCTNCYYESSHNKVSGRDRQLLKSAISTTNFEKTFISSPHYDNFRYSYENRGQTKTQPVDLQIDLGSTCNSACIMCPPKYSTRVYEDHRRLHKIIPTLIADPLKTVNWSDDTSLVEKFISELSALDNIKYIHFLGGETLYLKSFYAICDRLIDSGLSKNMIMGTTTNCTVYDDRIEHIIRNFKQVHLGLSIESITGLNDYIRWPSQLATVKENINKFLSLRETSNLQISLRITPNIFSIWQLDSLLEFMIENHVIAESCNILAEPSCLRMELLPTDLRDKVLDKIKNLIKKYDLTKPDAVIVNRRREDLIDPVIATVLFEYKEFLETYDHPDDVDQQRHDLVKFIKAYEGLHNNCILDHLPEYEEFLRRYGY